MNFIIVSSSPINLIPSATITSNNLGTIRPGENVPVQWTFFNPFGVAIDVVGLTLQILDPNGAVVLATFTQTSVRPEIYVTIPAYGNATLAASSSLRVEIYLTDADKEEAVESWIQSLEEGDSTTSCIEGRIFAHMAALEYLAIDYSDNHQIELTLI